MPEWPAIPGGRTRLQGTYATIPSMTQTESKHMLADVATPEDVLTGAIPASFPCDTIDQTLIPAISHDPDRIAEIDDALKGLPTRHVLCRADSRELGFVHPGSVHLIVTSPP